MLCGNKTDQCPNCRKYVRRAIFAYHYENNCADPDGQLNNGEIYQNQSSFSKFIEFDRIVYY